jgi:hypothetical protein
MSSRQCIRRNPLRRITPLPNPSRYLSVCATPRLENAFAVPVGNINPARTAPFFANQFFQIAFFFFERFHLTIFLCLLKSPRDLMLVTYSTNFTSSMTILTKTIDTNAQCANLISTALCGLFLVGCATPDKSMQNVNKDWNKAIRAAHIFPVSPLTQDLQPGDIFFTDKEIEDFSAWDKGGYLPLDHLVGRIYPNSYKAFYENSFAIGDGNSKLPKTWLTDNSWTNAPAAAFPGYTFKIQQGGAMNVSLPIQGVPVGLGLMGARNASGTVTIGDARTYGVDEPSLLKQVEEFVNKPENASALLKSMDTNAVKGNSPKRYFLQVVSRVFLTGKVSVSMVNDSSVGGSVSVGSAPATSIPSLTDTNVASNYSNLVTAVNAIIQTGSAAALPGGALKFSQVSARSVSMDETFAKPLVIGYTGFSVPISSAALNAILGRDSKGGPVPTRQVELRRFDLDPKARDRQLK